MTKDEALDLALEALELSSVTVDSFDVQRKTQEAITAIKQALAEPVQPVMTDEKGRPISFWGGKSVEPIKQPAPVAIALNTGTKQGVKWLKNVEHGVNLYTAQPAPASWMEMVTANLVREGIGKHKARELAEHFYSLAQRPWVGLTDEEFEDIELRCRSTPFGKIEAMQKVEAKLKEKNSDR